MWGREVEGDRCCCCCWWVEGREGGERGVVRDGFFGAIVGEVGGVLYSATTLPLV